MAKYIPLDRQFRDLTEDERIDPTGLASLSEDYFEQLGFGWSKLLASHRVVILAEAGSGKTKELQAQADALWAEGKPAFFIPIEDLDTRSVEEILAEDHEKLARFQEWQAGEGDVTPISHPAITRVLG